MFLSVLYKKIEELTAEIKHLQDAVVVFNKLNIIYMNDQTISKKKTVENQIDDNCLLGINQDVELNVISELNRQVNQDKKANTRIRKRRIWQGTYAQFKYDGAFEIALNDYSRGYKQATIAEKLNSMGYITPRGFKFDQPAVSSLLNDWYQKDRYNKRKIK